MKVIITGGCGFIGSSFVHLLDKFKIDYLVVDKMTYASNINNIPNKDKLLVKDICDITEGDLGEYDYLVNFAAESHVDNSIKDGTPFVKTNIQGTFNLLEVARKNKNLKKFIQISTDEVYGDLDKLGKTKSLVTDSLHPSSYYSSTKASADLIVQSAGHTFELPYLITRTCNNFGDRQHTEKFIPTVFRNILNGGKIPIYGDGKQKREWIWVEDNVERIYSYMISPYEFGIKHIGSGEVLENIEIIDYIKEITKSDVQYEYVEDRKGHDRMYCLHSTENKKMYSIKDYLKEKLC